MATINLRAYYPFCESDATVQVPDDLAKQLEQWEKSERTYSRKRRRYHATYSLDWEDGMERFVLLMTDSPDECYEKRLIHEQLHTALSALPDKQARRIYAHYFLGLSKAEIARIEGVGSGTVSENIFLGLKTLEHILKNQL